MVKITMQSVQKRRNFLFTVVLASLLLFVITQWTPDSVYHSEAKEADLSENEFVITQPGVDSESDIESRSLLKTLYSKYFPTVPPSATTTNQIHAESDLTPTKAATGDRDIYANTLKPIWTYRCNGADTCVRDLLKENETPTEPEVCWLNCGTHGALWPYPTADTKLGKCLTPFYINNLKLAEMSVPTSETKAIMQDMWDVFISQLGKMQGDRQGIVNSDINHNTIGVNIFVTEGDAKIGLDTDELYQIKITPSPNGEDCKYDEPTTVDVKITTATIFGARHALETLLQLAAYDKRQNCFQVVNNVDISDAPAYPYRGILIDTARNFIPIPDLKRMIDGMSHNKLNIFHWHISDSNSFGFYSKRVPKMAQYGAYSEDKIYYPGDIQDLLNYAVIRGVKVLPEFDAPAHAGNGWQWGPSEGLGELALCVNAEPWRSFCGQPPCGQLNPMNPNTLSVLEKLYEDFLEAFDDDLFHMGGDEVYISCWQSHPNVSSWMKQGERIDFMNIWGFFQQEALKRLKKANKNKNLQAIVWTSGMTSSKSGRQYLGPEDYIVQVWDGSSQVIRELLQENYQLIMSNVDALYLDHGGGSWLGREHVYEYKMWQKLYDNRLKKFLTLAGKEQQKNSSSRQILGGEATLWSEKVNSQNMDSKTWPRGAAVAENLWSDPGSRPPLVYSRLNHHNRRMIQLGIHSDQLQPESCYLISGHCEDPRSHI